MATKQQRRRVRRILETQLQVFPFDTQPFIDRAIRDFPQNPGAYARALILNSKAFRHAFPGIFRPDGTLRMTPGQYRQQQSQFQDIAVGHGFNLTGKSGRALIGQFIARGRDPREFLQWARGIQLAQTNPQVKGFLNQQIEAINARRQKAAKGGDYKRIAPLRTDRDVVKFFAGRSDRELYSVYEGALFQSQAAAAGIDISAGRARQLAKGTAGIAQEEDIEQGFANIAQELRLAGVELTDAGLTARDLQTIEFGGPNRAQLAQKAQAIIERRQTTLAAPNAPGVATGLTDDFRPVVRQTTQPANLPEEPF